MNKDRGFSLIELLIVVVMLGIIAAIAIPNLMAARRSANEAGTVAALRTIHGAQITYARTYGNSDYAGTAGGLDGVALTQLGSVGLVDPLLASGSKAGYIYTSGMTVATSSSSPTFCARAVPMIISGPTQTGARCFGVATDGVIMSNSGSIAGNCACTTGAAGIFVDNATPLGN